MPPRTPLGYLLWVCKGVLESRRQAHTGVQSMSTMPVQYGIYKGKTVQDKKWCLHCPSPVAFSCPLGPHAELTGACVDATLHIDGVPNTVKLEFSLMRMRSDGMPVWVVAGVPHFNTRQHSGLAPGGLHTGQHASTGMGCRVR